MASAGAEVNPVLRLATALALRTSEALHAQGDAAPKPAATASAAAAAEAGPSVEVLLSPGLEAALRPARVAATLAATRPLVETGPPATGAPAGTGASIPAEPRLLLTMHALAQVLQRMLVARNPALAEAAQAPGLPPAVARTLIALGQAMLQTGVFDASLLADAYAGRLPHADIARYQALARALDVEPAAAPAPGPFPAPSPPAAGAPATSSASFASGASAAPATPAAPGHRSPSEAVPSSLMPSSPLDVLTSGSLTLQAAAWADVPVSIRFFRSAAPQSETREAEDSRQGGSDARPPQGSWCCHLALRLSSLGALAIDFVERQGAVDVTITADAANRDRFATALERAHWSAAGAIRSVSIAVAAPA